jgi:hypothetical protein
MKKYYTVWIDRSTKNMPVYLCIESLATMLHKTRKEAEKVANKYNNEDHKEVAFVKEQWI